ncbi:hypothetical protein EDB86DRAFT_2882188 [Lactarius hatsudake]|nr:hypothetical protein EDB86DRAFT_2882188 [Lactarius hatsudake]
MSRSSEQEPLLPSSYSQDRRDQSQTASPSTWREHVSEALESPTAHKSVITLIVIDAGCVLVDLAYTLLSSECEPSGGPDAPAWLEVLSFISTVITTLFLPHGRVPHASLHLFDATIIVTTFVLEVVLRGKERELVGLLITLRLWRLLKLVGGVAVGAGEIEEDTVKELAQVKCELEKSRSALVQTREENQELRARVTWLEFE